MEPSSAPWRVIDAEPEPPTPEPGRERPWAALGAAVLALLVLGGAWLATTRGETVIEVEGAGPSLGRGPDREPSPAAAAVTPDLLVVEVAGAVASPGVYRLPPGSRVGDAIRAAGGFAPAVDAVLADRQLNLAAPLRDGEEIRVPRRGDAAVATGPPESQGGAAAGPAGLVDLNRATATELDTLPGVGPVTAGKIIAAREEQAFGSVDDLLARKVVGPATLEKLRPLVTVGP